MNTAPVGKAFYDMLMDIGEDYTITKLDGTKFTGKISLEPMNYSKMLEEREYLMQGAATFPDIQSQNDFRGCYFTRNIDHPDTYIMVSVIPEPTDQRIGYIYCVECNETVSLAYLEEQINEKLDTVTVPVVFASDVKVYFDTTLQKQRRSADGNFDVTSYYMQMPAHYGLSEDQVVLRRAYEWDDKNKKNVLVDRRYRVESVTLSMADESIDGNVYGIMDVQLSIDTRG